jgi:Family of unknown function (DUF6011)
MSSDATNATAVADMPADATRQTKAALKKAYPGTYFAVTSRNEIWIKWTDKGPTIEQVQHALLKARCAEAETAWNGELRLRGPGRSFYYFDRFNLVEQQAEQAERERRHQEYEARRQREDAAVREAAAKRQAAYGPSRTYQWSPAPRDPAQDQKTYETFEALRQRAETDVANNIERQVRPSWAPPLIIEGELLEACRELGHLAPDAKPIARLWAGFADPKKTGQILREQRGRHTLSGVVCRGFQLHAGGERGPTSSILFEAQRTETGTWQFGPRLYTPDYYSPRSYEWERLVRERERCRGTFSHSLEEARTHVERLSAQIAVIDAEDLADARAYQRRQHVRERAVELAKTRVLDFAGAPGAQMQMAGRLCGQCFNCFRELTDPISLERGIGPDCLADKVAYIKSAAQEMREQGRPVDVPFIAFWSEMPDGFVTTIVNEM